MKAYISFSYFFFFSFLTFAQNTVGVLSIDNTKTFEGYNLFFPHNNNTVYLVDNCGELVHSWVGDSDFRPGNMVYLLENGDLLKCSRFFNPTMDSIWAGGGGELVELLDWDGSIKWSFRLKDEFDRLHHDIAPMPNGNVLMIAWELKNFAESLQAGRDPAKMSQQKVWPDYILEYNPTMDSIVWEWHAWDHLIQDFDEAKDNFGVVNEHPELININYDSRNGHPDWLHSNSIDYHEELDQILLSIPYFDEIWIIDHSTTTEEAKGHTGGRSGKGGDLIFRWGNPAAYQGIGEQQVFFAHDAHWIDDLLPSETPYYGDIMIFNNQVAGNTISTVDIIRPEIELGVDSDEIVYAYNEETGFLPESPQLTLFHPDTFPLYSSGLSSAQLLPNKNILTLAGRTGHAFEINPATKEVVWDYKIPLQGGSPVAQGEVLTLNQNITFRLKRYPLTYPAFEGRDLSSQGYLELEPNTTFCNLSVGIEDLSITDLSIKIYPNPVSDNLIIEQEIDRHDQLLLTDLTGKVLKNIILNGTKTIVDVSDLSAGLYFIRTKDRAIGKVIIF